MASQDSLSLNIGTLVFSGDINNKKHEFIFKPNGKKIPLENNIFNSFSNVYFKNENSIDGQFWKQKFKNKDTKIPIFYKENKGKVEAVGLTQLFKLDYKKTLLDASEQNTKDKKLDLAQTIFGTIDDHIALKGRVQFSHLKSTILKFENKQKEEVLGSPNPTYYPNYIKQNDTSGNKVNNYTTLMFKDAEISGWKRYPLQESIQSYPLPKNENGKINHDVATKFKPLDAGTVFKGKLRFHNLKKCEIGALLSAITFHGNQSTHMHNIGMAKGLGYGKISIKLNIDRLNYKMDDYLKEYENIISKDITNWIDSPQIKELLSMSSIDVKSSELLKYQLLENKNPPKGEKEKNDFIRAKKSRDYLVPYTQFGLEINEKNLSNTSHDITKKEMSDAIKNYWKIKYNIFYHPNQIKEFLANVDFKTTPKNIANVYIKNKDDKNFVVLIQMINKFFNNKLDYKTTRKLYDTLKKVNII